MLEEFDGHFRDLILYLLSRTKVQIIDNKATVNVRELPKGIYILKITIDQKIETHQIIVE